MSATTPATQQSSAHKHAGAFDNIGDQDDVDLSEIRLDMKEGGQRDSLSRMKRQLIVAEQKRKSKVS